MIMLLFTVLHFFSPPKSKRGRVGKDQLFLLGLSGEKVVWLIKTLQRVTISN